MAGRLYEADEPGLGDGCRLACGSSEGLYSVILGVEWLKLLNSENEEEKKKKREEE